MGVMFRVIPGYILFWPIRLVPGDILDGSIRSNMASVHADVYSPAKRADYQVAIAGEAIARARVQIAQRGLTATVVQNYYAMAVAARHIASLQRGLNEASHFLDITRKQEAGGEAARADVVKAQIEVNARERDLREARLAADKARIGFAVYLFADFRQDFAVVDDLDQLAVLPAFPEIEALAGKENPDVRAAQGAVTQNTYGIKSARAALLPTFSLDYFYGLQANQYALHNAFGENNLGSSMVAGLTVPVWNWGAHAAASNKRNFDSSNPRWTGASRSGNCWPTRTPTIWRQ
jgi:outer membrane protein TolC